MTLLFVVDAAGNLAGHLHDPGLLENDRRRVRGGGSAVAHGELLLDILRGALLTRLVNLGEGRLGMLGVALVRLDVVVACLFLSPLLLRSAATFAGMESKSVVNVCQEWSKAVQNQRSPSFKAVSTNEGLKAIQVKIEAMLKYDVAGVSFSSSRFRVGKKQWFCFSMV